MDLGRPVDRVLERALLLGGDEVGQVGVGRVFLVHRVQVVEQDVRGGRVQVGAAYPRIRELVGGQLVSADRVDQHHAREEGVLVPVQQVLPDRGGPPGGTPLRLLRVADEHHRQLVPEPRHLGGAGDLREVSEGGAEGPQHRLPLHHLLELRQVLRREPDRVHHGMGQRQPLAEQLRCGVLPFVDPVVVHGPLRQAAPGRREQPVGVVAVRVRQHEQPPELVRAQPFQPPAEQPDLGGPGHQPLVDLLPERRIVPDRVRAVQRRHPHRAVGVGRAVGRPVGRLGFGGLGFGGGQAGTGGAQPGGAGERVRRRFDRPGGRLRRRRAVAAEQLLDHARGRGAQLRTVVDSDLMHR